MDRRKSHTLSVVGSGARRETGRWPSARAPRSNRQDRRNLKGLLAACAMNTAVFMAGLVGPGLIDGLGPVSARAAAYVGPGIPIEGGVRVIDGDTVELLANGERLRLSNIDTPEMPPRSQCDEEAALATAATAKLREMVVAAREIRMVADIGRTHDRYGRRLGRLLIDGADVGEAQMEAGLAEPWLGHRAYWCG